MNPYASVAEVRFARYSYHNKPFRTQRGNRPFVHYYIRWQVEGQCKARINGETWQDIYPGDLLLFRPGDQCQLSFGPGKKSNQVRSGNYYLICRGDWIKNWWDENVRPQKTKIALNETMLSIFREVSLELQQRREGWEEAASYLLRILLISIHRSLHTARDMTDSKAFMAHRMKSFIEDHKTIQLKVEDVAKHVGLSESRASHIFKEVFDISIIHYSLEVRLSEACDLICYTNLPLEQIADISGFGSYTHFHRAFRKKYLMSPVQFRNEANNASVERKD